MCEALVHPVNASAMWPGGPLGLIAVVDLIGRGVSHMRFHHDQMRFVCVEPPCLAPAYVLCVWVHGGFE